jgi:catechol 2,3-dioxygenase-like lactoylglutathione lyase family enzyme
MDSLASKQIEFNMAFVTIIVADMQRSIDFYTAQLGFKLKARYGNEFAIVEGPGVTIGLHPPSSTSAIGNVSIGLGVDDVEKRRDQLQLRGIAFEGGIVADPPMRFAYLKDPNGVQLYLAEQAEFT